MADETYIKALLEQLLEANARNDKIEVEKIKCDLIYSTSNFFEAATMYIALENIGYHFDFGCHTIQKGTKLYRIRRFDENVDFSSECQWTPPPHKPQNRANKQGEEALYLSVDEATCILETHLNDGEKYVLGEYQCEENIVVGGYISTKSNPRLVGIGNFLNAILIAPSRNEYNVKLFELLDKHYGTVLPKDLKWDAVKNNFCLPFKCGVMNKREEYYKITNMLCEIIKRRYSDGIKYSSSYMPLEALGLESNCYNVALYTDGIKKLRFIKHEIKTKKNDGFNSVEIAKLILNTKNDC